jgi:hypothetical protein
MAASKTGIVHGLRVFFLALGVVCLCQAASGVPDRKAPGEPATTQVTILVPAAVDSFANHRLEVALHQFDPRGGDHETLIDVHIDKAFTHNRGVPNQLLVTIGAQAMTNPDMYYSVTVAAFNAHGKRSHLGELDGKRGLVQVLTAGKSNQVTVTLRQATPKDIVLDLADEIKRGNHVKVTAMAKARAKDFEELLDVEDLYRRRNKDGMGWGSTPGPNGAQDGLEPKLFALSRAVPANFVQDAKNNEEAALWIQALAELVAVKPDFKPMGKKTLADWEKKAAALRTEADAFAKAVAAQNVLAIRTSAQGVVNACTNCHIIYRD